MTNPYAPPPGIDPASKEDALQLSEPLASGSTQSLADARSFMIRMGLLVCGNAIVPILFAANVTSTDAKQGMVLGLLIVLAASIVIGINAPRVQPVLVRGAWALCLTQILPLGQFFAGMIALMFCDSFGLAVLSDDDHPVGYLESFAGGFACTIMTALLLLLFVVPVGFLLARNAQHQGETYSD